MADIKKVNFAVSLVVCLHGISGAPASIKISLFIYNICIEIVGFCVALPDILSGSHPLSRPPRLSFSSPVVCFSILLNAKDHIATFRTSLSHVVHSPHSQRATLDGDDNLPKPHVVVIGAGQTGSLLTARLRLELDKLRLTLIDAKGELTLGQYSSRRCSPLSPFSL